MNAPPASPLAVDRKTAPASAPPPLGSKSIDGSTDSLADTLVESHADSLAEALAIADAQPDVRAAAQALRLRFAPRRVVVVDAFDMRHEPPATTGQRVRLYYAACDGHCWRVTDDARQAAGFFVAAI
ncbi:hypothetical protein AACH06_21355 [Ideonella sp. DXS29W]|uniref:Uncharacterized protein n=1 Tax=Ideonella lacteola TaxID=2984193 RepID=A0ABU9BW75_9BURK